MTIRVLLIINRLEDHGGAEVSTGLLLDGLQGEGFDFTVVTLFGPATLGLRSELEARGARFLEATGSPRARWAKAHEIARTWQPDLIHSTLFDADVTAMLVGARLAIPTLTSVVNTAYSPAAEAVALSKLKLQIVARAVGLMQRFGFSRCHAITQAAADGIQSTVARTTRTTVIPRGRRASSAPRSEALRLTVRRDLAINDQTFVILNVARQERQKGHDLLLAAFSKFQRDVPDSLLLIAGRGGHATAAITAQIEDLGLTDSVRLLDVRDDIDELHAASDVFAFSSRWEGLGGALIEAMAAGSPIVAFDIPAVAEVCETTARLASPFSTDSFAVELRWVHDHPAQAGVLADRGRQRFETHYELDDINTRMADLYRQVSRRQAPPLSRVIAPRRARQTARRSRAKAALLNGEGSPVPGPQLIAVTGEADFEPIRAEWNALASRLPSTSFFCSADWAAAWWFAHERRPVAEIAVWRSTDGEMTAVIGLDERTERLHTLIPLTVRYVAQLGSGRGGADHLGFLVHPVARDAVTSWMRERLAGRTLLTLDVAVERLQSLRLEEAEIIGQSACVSSPLPLPVSAGFARKLRRYARRLEQEGIEIECVGAGDVTQQHIRDFDSLQKQLRRAKGATSSISKFHVRLLVHLAGLGQPGWGLTATVARQSGRTVGVLLGFQTPGRYEFFQIGWDPALAPFNVGTMLIHATASSAHEHGAEHFDFLRGDEEYKRRFGGRTVLDYHVLQRGGANAGLLALRERSRRS